MSLTIELTPAEEALLRAEAQRAGQPLTDYARQRLLEERQPPWCGDRTQELLAQWSAENEGMTEEEAKQADAEWEELKANLNANRVATGEQPLFL